jgi:hypothetical protein
MNPRYILLDGKAYVWRELVKLRRDQLRTMATVRQLTLFELREDVRPEFHRKASGRYLQPSLFTSDASD